MEMRQPSRHTAAQLTHGHAVKRVILEIIRQRPTWDELHDQEVLWHTTAAAVVPGNAVLGPVKSRHLIQGHMGQGVDVPLTNVVLLLAAAREDLHRDIEVAQGTSPDLSVPM